MTSTNRKIRWGVLGYAKIARESVIPAIQKSRNGEFYAIASRDALKLKECQDKFGAPKAYVGYQELIDDPKVDAVYIPLPNVMHKEWTIKAAEKEKHVLCEKPLGLDANEAREMVAFCAKKKVKFMEAFMYRYTHRTQKVLEVVRSGVLGEIKFIAANFRFLLANPASIKLKPELGGGSLYDVGCYPINFIGMVLDAANNSKPGSISPESVVGQSIDLNGIDMIFSGVLKYSSGVIATVNSGFNAHKRVFCEVVGTKGLMEVPDSFFDEPGFITVTVDGNVRQIPIESWERYKLEVEDFSDAILNDGTPLFSLDETIRNAEVLDRLMAAAGLR